MRYVFAVVLLASVAVMVGAAGEENLDELERLRRQAAELEQRLHDLEGQQQARDRERRVLEAQLALEAVRVRESEAELARLKAQEAEAQRHSEAGRAAYGTALAQLRRQLSLLAVFGRSGLAPMLWHAIASGADVAQRVTTVLAIVRHQESERQAAAALLEERNSALAELSRRRAEVDEALARLAARRRSLDDTRRRVLAELAKLEGERRRSATALASAHEAEARLERLWGVVTGGGERPSPNLKRLRGGLPWPVAEARVVRPFGARRDPRYGTVTVSHGIDLETAAGQPVNAVASGAVIYAQYVKGYGNVVILDHGHGVYSLYGRLASTLVRGGSRVAMGEPLGMTGAAEAGEGNVYLEIRVNDKPQDPLAWLRSPEKRGAA